jgi:hypothetical protein
MQILYRRLSGATRLALPILTLVTASCSSVLDSSADYADNAIIEVTGTSPVPLLLVSSTDWVHVVSPVTGERTIATNKADTVSLQLPINRTVPITNQYRIFFSVVNPDSVQTATIRMRVMLDKKLVYDQAATMRDASLQFSFAYGHSVGQ